MKKISGTVVPACLALFAIFIYGTVKGWILAFHASVILGVLVLFLQGSGFVEWVVNAVSGYDIAAHLARALGLS